MSSLWFDNQKDSSLRKSLEDYPVKRKSRIAFDGFLSCNIQSHQKFQDLSLIVKR